MVQPITQVRAPTPPVAIVKLFQSGAISDDEIVRFFSWLDGVIRGNGTKRDDLKVEDLLCFFFTPDRVKELAARIRTNPLSEATGAYSPERLLTDYLKLDKPIVFFDIETAGVEGKARFKVIEISMVKYYPDGKKEAWTQRINPEVPIQKQAIEIHGINDLAVSDCPTFRQAAPALYAFFKDCHLGGFNILRFDIMALQKEFAQGQIDFSIKGRAVIDPMVVYHKNVPYKEGESRTLTDAVEMYCKRELENAHQAKADILATIEVLKGQFEVYVDLPRDVYELSDYCSEKHYDISDFVDPEGKFVFDDGEVVFNFGKKHMGRTLKEVVATDEGYLLWMLSEKKDGEKGFSEAVKTLVRNALKGIYPSCPVKTAKE